ncbi:hypothetical protein NEIG_00928 [Nematocida sp. ERTm5]|nr:hypothetical protein NEIG_00928 [Nematocida sp. ERTm5]
MELFYILIILGALCVEKALGMKVIFANNQSGYLYNIGGKGYITNSPVNGVNGVKNALSVTNDVDDALELKVTRKSFKDLTYHTISAADNWCQRSTESQRGMGKCVFSYTKDLGTRAGVALSPEKGSFNNYFMFSLPLTRKTNAFQIYNQGMCLGIDSVGALDLSDCVEETSLAKDRQLFMWVDKAWFDRGMKKKRDNK